MKWKLSAIQFRVTRSPDAWGTVAEYLPCVSKLVFVDIVMWASRPVSSGCGFGYCPDAHPGLGNHLPNESSLRSEHRISSGRNFLGHHPGRDVVRYILVM